MPAGAFTLADIQSADWSLALDSPGEPGSGIGSVVQGLADVDQCVQIILTTPKGSDPLRPTFGADVWQYIDYPINLAIPAVVREVTEAITLWEPRIQLVSVKVQPAVNSDAQSGAHLNINVLWRLRLTTGRTTSAALAPAQTTNIAFPITAGL